MFILVDIRRQILSLHLDCQNRIEYSVSTGAKGVGQLLGSGKTPLGKHVVRAKIGANQPENTVFIARRPTGERYCQRLAADCPARKDWILSRILWLSGCELGFNRLGKVDTMRRFIYIHGTPDAEKMGEPLSHGCIRMRNKDVIDLFHRVAIGTSVEILID